ncbi:MAG: hypothetical protein MI740_07200, partial [Halanaerobiales bacterium]|nr:hypothetical protein [Halanaerobiales bacterium]
MKPLKRSFYILGHYPFLYLLMLPALLSAIYPYLGLQYLFTIPSNNDFIVAFTPLVFNMVNGAFMLVTMLIFTPALGQHLHDITTGGPKPRFFTRGIQSHWYKPFVLYLITIAASLIVLLALGLIALIAAFISGFSMTTPLLVVIVVCGVFALALIILLS